MPTFRVILAAAAGVSATLALAVAGPEIGVRAGAEPSTTPTTPSTSTPATSPPATSVPSTSVPSTSAYPSDRQGYLDSAARCGTDEVLMVHGRTARALVAICVDGDAELLYRGERLSDGASVELPAGRASDGSIVATNDGVTYSVSSAAFLVSEGDTVLYRDPWVEFREGRFAEPTTTTASGPPTVSTTTVTMTPTVTSATTPGSGADG